MQESEEWKSIPGYENIYEISSLGRVKRLPGNRIKKERIMNPWINSNKLFVTGLCKNGKEKLWGLGRLMAITFLGLDPSDDFEVKYKNGNKLDNRRINILPFNDLISRIEAILMDNHTREPMSGCWLWTGEVNGAGYGYFNLFNKRWISSRASYHALVDPVPDELVVCHHCDMPSCINPQHLFLGTHKDNSQDMLKKGRNKTPGMRGEALGHNKLTEAKVLEIRKLLSDGVKGSEIAKIMGVSNAAISRVKLNQYWKHVPTQGK
jgi:NUMOD4 motif/HNH endonuclease